MQWNFSGKQNVYLENARQYREDIGLGIIKAGDKLPSVRYAATEMGVNPNTVQKACRTLEDEGLLRSFAGSKSVMQLNEATIRAIRAELMTAEALTAVRALQQMGIGRAEAMVLLEQAWDTAEAQSSLADTQEATQ